MFILDVDVAVKLVVVGLLIREPNSELVLLADDWDYCKKDGFIGEVLGRFVCNYTFERWTCCEEFCY